MKKYTKIWHLGDVWTWRHRISTGNGEFREISGVQHRNHIRLWNVVSLTRQVMKNNSNLLDFNLNDLVPPDIPKKTILSDFPPSVPPWVLEYVCQGNILGLKSVRHFLLPRPRGKCT